MFPSDTVASARKVGPVTVVTTRRTTDASTAWRRRPRMSQAEDVPQAELARLVVVCGGSIFIWPKKSRLG
jgi:hypothetical protein